MPEDKTFSRQTAKYIEKCAALIGNKATNRRRDSLGNTKLQVIRQNSGRSLRQWYFAQQRA